LQSLTLIAVSEQERLKAVALGTASAGRQRVKAKFHYAMWFGAGRRPASNQLRTSSEPASVMEFGF